MQSLTEVTKDTYAVDTNDVPILNEGIMATARHLSNSQSLLEDEARAWENGILEDLKFQRDCLNWNEGSKATSGSWRNCGHALKGR